MKMLYFTRDYESHIGTWGTMVAREDSLHSSEHKRFKRTIQKETGRKGKRKKNEASAV